MPFGCWTKSAHFMWLNYSRGFLSFYSVSGAALNWYTFLSKSWKDTRFKIWVCFSSPLTIHVMIDIVLFWTRYVLHCT